MQATEIELYARQLLEAQGERAIATAAEKAHRFERDNNAEEAHLWRRIEAALMLLRGPRES